jgi:hypothetical protein
MSRPPQPSTHSVRSSNLAHNRRNAAKVEQYLTDVEKVQGFAKSWALRERLESGDARFADRAGGPGPRRAAARAA